MDKSISMPVSIYALGGLGEAVCGVLCEEYPAPVKRLGINDEFGYSGSAEELIKAFGLDGEGIATSTKNFLAN